MRKIPWIFLLIVTALPSLVAQSQIWEIDPAHSSVQFTIQHMLISEVTGKFHEFSGKAIISEDDFSSAQIEGFVNIGSIDSGNERRDNHLKLEDFFYAEKYPEMTFKSTKVEKINMDTYQITGDLTIRGVTKTVVFDAKHGGTITAFGTQRMGWQATTTINRFDFGINWNKTIETGGLIAGDMVTINITVEFIKQE
ncbi:MAG: polyisoprenoid-binding protein [Candidatus Marinimicrobia bacterium]|nr:polyisoprenoid-binding protein [Candidatus Neomarinimicrobiota bacterium]